MTTLFHMTGFTFEQTRIVPLAISKHHIALLLVCKIQMQIKNLPDNKILSSFLQMNLYDRK